jgi:uncharacterized protein
LNEIVQILLRAGAGIDITDIDGRTALHWVALNGMDTVAKTIILTLLKWNADVRVKDKHGHTALDYAKSKGVIEVLEAKFCDPMQDSE